MTQVKKQTLDVAAVKRVTEQAGEVIERDRGNLAEWVRALCQRFGVDWFSRALERLRAKLETVHVANPRGYVARVLAGFADEGGPPPDALTVEESAEAELIAIATRLGVSIANARACMV